MGIITIRVDEELKKKMESLSHINWSDIVRKAIIERVNEEELWRRIDRGRLIQAASLNDALRREVKGWNSVMEIRRWRERGSSGR